MPEPNIKPIGAWRIWDNPILARYCRSRLRMRHLLPWALVVLIATLFVVFLLYTAAQRTDYSIEHTSRITLIPLMVIQSLLLMLLGTGAVAAGIVRESTEGMIEYQRLTPMTPLAKIIGYAFGLPIREYVLACVPLPFVAWAAWKGGVAWDALGRFYAVFLMAVLLYHLTGLVAGSVVKKKFLAGRTAQALVVVLYLILPRFSNLGFVFLIYLTVLPAWREQAIPYMGEDQVIGLFPGLGDQVPWFRWDFSPTVFSLMIQGALILVFVIILARKWRDPASHMMANYTAVLVFAGVMLLLLGNSFPLIDSGDFFYNAEQFGGPFRNRDAHEPFAWIALALMGLAILGAMLLLTKFITPSRDEARRGFRRATKLKASHVAPFSDDVTALWPVIGLVVVGVLGWGLFTGKLTASPPFEGVVIQRWWWFALAASLTLPTLAFYAVIERYGGRAVLVAMLLAWIVPALAAIIMAASGKLETAAIYTASLSGFLMPVYAIVQMGLEAHPPPNGFGPKVQSAFLFSMIVYTILVPALMLQLLRYRQRLMKDTGFSS